MSLPAIRYRLLTVTMFMSFLLLGAKVGDIFRGGQEISRALVNEASAQQDATKPADPAKPAADAKAGAATAEKKTEADGKEKAPSPIDAVDKEDKTKSEGSESAEKKPEEKAADDKASETEKASDVKLPGGAQAEGKKFDSSKEFSAEDINLLQSLSRRRDEIDSWAKQVEMKENMLGATEQRINDKIAQLKDLQKQLDKVLAQYNEHEDAKIRSLVKIYESMKPADAARIFDELEMPIMLEVVDKMSERKAAPILANMNPLKAKELTVELAEQRKLQQPMMDAISASQAAGASDTPPAPADTKEEAQAPAPAPAPAAP